MFTRPIPDETKAIALATLHALGQVPGALTIAANATGVNHWSLSRWNNGQSVSQKVSVLVKEKERQLDAKIEELAHLLLAAAPGKIASASLQQTTTSLAIAIDKMLLLRGQPNNINLTAEIRVRTFAERVQEFAETHEISTELAAKLLRQADAEVMGETVDTEVVETE